MTKKEQALVEQYAKSLVEVYYEHQMLDQLQTDLAALIQVFEQTDLDEVLGSFAVSQEYKEEILRLLKDSSSTYMNNFLDVIIQNQRQALLYSILKASSFKIAQLLHEFEVKVTTTVPLTDQQKDRIRTIVEKKVGVKAAKIIEDINPAIVGGFIISVNNKVIDTSIRGQLQEFKSKLV
ncbi:F0F1 ATP synthase subunit delta [Streptococcus halichoeri]|uniref:F0F1 ATP synthase subunit delta n=1 Tax=Streptococcus halichoeri TaxID=254785 RepID=UPI001359AADF|nr:F0F1 ATP synthase subunit delta [Streptococcus halichoeri]